jgi:glutathione S-transferase
MHSGFSELRKQCSMSCGVLIRLSHFSEALVHDVARLSVLWGDGLHRFGGPFLAGSAFTAVDAFFAPVAFRIRSYSLALELPAAEYGARLLARKSMQEWYAAALQETFRDVTHEDEIGRMGEVLEDLRAR